MTYIFLSIEEALRNLPTLRSVLGQRWIDRESNTPPLESAFPLARTLRIKESGHLHITLDRRLADLWDVPGADDWRNRLRHNGEELRELQTERAFARFLQQRGYDFEHPAQEPDFSIALSSAAKLVIEATTPRIIMWDDDLDTRLWILSRQFGYSVRTEPSTEEMQILSEEVTEQKVRQTVTEAIQLLSAAAGDGSVIVQEVPGIGLKITWTPSAQPMFSGRNSPSSSHIRAFNHVWNACEKKVKQLKSVGAHTLLIGTNQLPFPEWAQYVESIRRQGPYFGDFDWTQIHPQIDRIILFQATYGDNRLSAVDVLTRPSALSLDSVGLARFLQDLNDAREHHRLQSEEDERELVTQLMDYETRQRSAEATS